MNRLTHKAPRAVMIDGVKHLITPFHRNCLLILEAMEDEELFDVEKWEILLENFYQEPYPTNLQKAFEMFQRFIVQDKKEGKKEPQVIDFAQDSKYIHDALLSINVNLDKIDDLHWWDLISYLAEVKDTTFNRIVYLRTQKNRGKLSKDERKECAHIGWDVINIKRKLSAEEQAEKDHFERLLND